MGPLCRVRCAGAHRSTVGRRRPRIAAWRGARQWRARRRWRWWGCSARGLSERLQRTPRDAHQRREQVPLVVQQQLRLPRAADGARAAAGRCCRLFAAAFSGLTSRWGAARTKLTEKRSLRTRTACVIGCAAELARPPRACSQGTGWASRSDSAATARARRRSRARGHAAARSARGTAAFPLLAHLARAPEEVHRCASTPASPRVADGTIVA